MTPSPVIDHLFFCLQREDEEELNKEEGVQVVKMPSPVAKGMINCLLTEVTYPFLPPGFYYVLYQLGGVLISILLCCRHDESDIALAAR
jgi:hypothetical protein